MILRRFDPLSCSLKRVHASMNMLFLMNKTKDKISRVSSHDLYWENKMYKRKRSIVWPPKKSAAYWFKIYLSTLFSVRATPMSVFTNRGSKFGPFGWIECDATQKT